MALPHWDAYEATKKLRVSLPDKNKGPLAPWIFEQGYLAGQAKMQHLQTALLEIQQVACSGSPELYLASKALALLE